MKLDTSLGAVAAFAKPEKFEDVRRNIPVQWIEEALAASGTATLRKRRLPAEQVVWLVIGMALFRDRSIHELVGKLDLALPGKKSNVVPSATADARKRLGAEPMKWLFERSGQRWAHESARSDAWRGLALYGVDGTSLRVPDSDENRQEFGVAKNGQSTSGYPLVRLVALMALRSRLMAAVSFGEFSTGELTYAKDVLDQIPDESLTILDRLYLRAPTLLAIQGNGQNRHWLTRAKSNTKRTLVKKLGPKDNLVELEVADKTRRKDSSLPKTYLAREIAYQHKGYKPQTLLTSLLDRDKYPAEELAQLYHERWEIELGYDEIKTDLLNREEAIRSRKVEGVRQELFGILLAYNLIRLEMERVAKDAKVSPNRISFVSAMRLIVDEWMWCAIANQGAIPKHLRNLRQDLAGLVLPPRRSERRYPRAVKKKMTSYPRNRGAP